MKCLCCGKPLTSKNSIVEQKNGWHAKCIKKFFGTKDLPDLDISKEALELLALESTGKGYTVPGVQKKLSLHLTEERNPRLTLVNYPTGYILKPQVDEYEALPEAEFLVMQMAEVSGIRTVPYALVKRQAKNTESVQDTELAYITKRIDRIFSKDAPVEMLAMEDFCQLDYRLTQDKYRGSYERCAKIIKEYSCRPGLDLSELYMRLVFSYVIGNSDMHLKNFSLIETSAGSGSYILSDAYDLLPVNVIMPEDTEQFALTMNGKKRNIRRNDFLKFGENCGLPIASAKKMIDKIVSLQDIYKDMCRESYLPDDMKENLIQLISERVDCIE